MQHLQARHKWHKPVCNIKVGDIVMLKDNSRLRRYWPLACIASIYPGPDRLVRVMDIRCPGKNLPATSPSGVSFHRSQSVAPGGCSGFSIQRDCELVKFMLCTSLMYYRLHNLYVLQLIVIFIAFILLFSPLVLLSLSTVNSRRQFSILVTRRSMLPDAKL